MVQLEFHTGLGDPFGYACRLLRKADRQSLRVMVFGEVDYLARLDTLLWTFEQLEFVPHARLRAGERPVAALRRTPIWLVDRAASWPADWPPIEIAVNLGDAALDEPQRFKRVIEVVGNEPEAAHAGRARWRQYAGAGLKPVQANAKDAQASPDSQDDGATSTR